MGGGGGGGGGGVVEEETNIKKRKKKRKVLSIYIIYNAHDFTISEKQKNLDVLIFPVKCSVTSVGG